MCLDFSALIEDRSCENFIATVHAFTKQIKSGWCPTEVLWDKISCAMLIM